ncbi:hypothetical protein ACFO3U_08330 [Flavobacterium ponti]|uniref:Uncharacterized protein n=1 Tax=Flavobacterium ponti TaxID=665133 RepID=A0ABV9P6V1_9FLAO
MKKLLLFLFLFSLSISYSQVNPTLGIGLEALTLNKGTIDVEVLTKVILKKQKELKNEALKRFMLKMFPDTNYTTRFYVQNCLNILLNEKNPQVIEKEILELTTNYAIALGVTKAIVEIDNTLFDTEAAKAYKQIDYKKLVDQVNYESQITSVKDKIKAVSEQNAILIKESQLSNPNIDIINNAIGKIKTLEKEIKQTKRYLARNHINFELIDTDTGLQDSNLLNFGEKLDIVSLALSENDLLRKKGFFKNKINYREDQNYFYNEITDDSIKNRIEEKIKHYVQNYDVIKNFMENNTLKNSDNIVEDLNQIYLNQIDLASNFFLSNDSKTGDKVYKNAIDQLKSFLQLKSELDNLMALKKSLTSKINETNFSDLNPISPITSINSLQLTDKETLNSFKKQYVDLIHVYNYITKFNNTIDNIKTNANLTKIIGNSKLLENIKIPSLNLLNEAELNLAFDQLHALNEELTTLKNEAINNVEVSPTSETLKPINEKIVAFNKIIATIQKNITDNNKNIASFYKNATAINAKIEEIKQFDLTAYVTNSKDQIKNVQNNISKLPDFFIFFIDDLLKKIENEPYNQEVKIEKDSSTKNKVATLIATLYERLNYFKSNKNYTITDINFLENELLPQVVGLKYADNSTNNTYYDVLIKGIKNLTPLLKINILINKGLGDSTIKYDEKLISLFEFISNLDKLDKAQTYSSIVDLIKKNSEEITKILPDGEFKEGYILFINGVKKYTLINTNAENEYVEIDVISFLNDLQQHYDRNNPSSFSLYLTLGLNQNMFINKFQFSDSTEQLTSIGFASEKIGVKYKILDFKKYRGYENAIKSDIYLNKRAPFINEWYASVYGSGLLYSLANTTTNQNFNFPHVGFATGFRFYNALDFNVMLGLPFIKDQKFGNNGFVGIGFDIPLSEYLEALGNK